MAYQQKQDPFKDASIIAQNAGSTAAQVFAALVSKGVIDPESVESALDEYDTIRARVFEETYRLAGTVAEGVQRVERSFPGTTDASDAPAERTQRSSGGGGGDAGSLEVKMGKHRGKTISQIAEVDRDWLEWAGENISNDFLRKKIIEFLAA